MDAILLYTHVLYKILSYLEATIYIHHPFENYRISLMWMRVRGIGNHYYSSQSGHGLINIFGENGQGQYIKWKQY